jgi:hypothetical protein
MLKAGNRVASPNGDQILSMAHRNGKLNDGVGMSRSTLKLVKSPRAKNKSSVQL